MIFLFVLVDLMLLPILFRFCFGSLEGLIQAIRYTSKPDLFSMLDGSYSQDREHTGNWRLFVLLAGGLLMVEAWVISGMG